MWPTLGEQSVQGATDLLPKVSWLQLTLDPKKVKPYTKWMDLQIYCMLGLNESSQHSVKHDSGIASSKHDMSRLYVTCRVVTSIVTLNRLIFIAQWIVVVGHITYYYLAEGKHWTKGVPEWTPGGPPQVPAVSQTTSCPQERTWTILRQDESERPSPRTSVKAIKWSTMSNTALRSRRTQIEIFHE